jgi:hypothetical protein
MFYNYCTITVYTLTCIFVTNNKNQFAANCEIHSINTRNKSNFYRPLSILTSYQKGHYFGAEVFSCLHEHIDNLTQNMKQFKSNFKVFYSLE